MHVEAVFFLVSQSCVDPAFLFEEQLATEIRLQMRTLIALNVVSVFLEDFIPCLLLTANAPHPPLPY
jgi:hypothetical protein